MLVELFAKQIEVVVNEETMKINHVNVHLESPMLECDEVQLDNHLNIRQITIFNLETKKMIVLVDISNVHKIDKILFVETNSIPEQLLIANF